MCEADRRVGTDQCLAFSFPLQRSLDGLGSEAEEQVTHGTRGKRGSSGCGWPLGFESWTTLLLRVSAPSGPRRERCELVVDAHSRRPVDSLGDRCA
jgi:hypothetical protein